MRDAVSLLLRCLFYVLLYVVGTCVSIAVGFLLGVLIGFLFAGESRPAQLPDPVEQRFP